MNSSKQSCKPEKSIIQSASKQMAKWEELPQELLKLIAQRLAIEDFVAFGAVCTSWLSAATKETYDAKSKAPWLVTNVNRQMPKFCSPSRGRIYPVKLSGTRAQTLSLRGWMLLSNCDHEYRIFNPVSRVSIELPAMEQLFSKSFIGLKPLRIAIKLPTMEQIFSKSFIGLKPLRITIKLPAMEQIFSKPFLSLEQEVQRIDKIVLSSSPSLSRSYAVMIAYHFAFGVPWLALHRSGERCVEGSEPSDASSADRSPPADLLRRAICGLGCGKSYNELLTRERAVWKRD